MRKKFYSLLLILNLLILNIFSVYANDIDYAYFFTIVWQIFNTVAILYIIYILIKWLKFKR